MGELQELYDELFDDLKTELKDADDDFREVVLATKLKNVLREVKRVRNYPKTSYYTNNVIKEDMHEYYAEIRNIALYDYNMIGMEFEKSDSTNEVSRSFVERDTLFSGILPIARM